MPIKKSAFKHARQTKKRAARNALTKVRLVQFVKQARKAVRLKDDSRVGEYLKNAQKIIDKAAQAGVLKKNTAARRKSRLIKKMRALVKTR